MDTAHLHPVPLREIRSAHTPEDLERVYVLIHELRTDLAIGDFLEAYHAAHHADGYTLDMVEAYGKPVAVMGYRVLHDLVHGRHLYVDDLVTTASERGRGHGALLLQHAELRAKELNCRSLRLCTGIDNHDAKRFYEREGWKFRSVVFKKKL